MTHDASVRLPGVMWHVTVTLQGQPFPPERLRAGLTAMAFHHGIGLSARFAPDTVELRYWDEGHDCRVVAVQGLDLWDQHRERSQLPTWAVVGLEVLDRASFQRRWPAGSGESRFTPGVEPMGAD